MAAITHTLRPLRNYLSIAMTGAYLVLLSTLILSEGIVESFLPILLCAVNYFLTLAFLTFNAHWRTKLFLNIIYFSFFLVYVLKGFILFSFDLSSVYVVTTIGVSIQSETYIFALLTTTLGHALLVIIALLFSLLAGRSQPRAEKNTYWSRQLVFLSLTLIFLFTLISSVVMSRAGVGVMGSEGVSLPFKLSGVFFYGRTIFIPILLLFFVERCIVYGDRRLFRIVIVIYVFLAGSDTFIRASKEPFIALALVLLTLSLLLSYNGSQRHRLFDGKTIFGIFGLGLLTFPVIEIYRLQTLAYNSADLTSLANVISLASDGNSGFILHAVERFFHRLLGFTQMAGLIEIEYPRQSLLTILESGGFSKYYTHSVLGFTFMGHLSSPSLMGAFFLLGGALFWPIFMFLYVGSMYLFWRYASLFRSFKFSVRAMLSYEILNTMIAGSIDASIFRIFLIFSFCFGCETLVHVLSAQKHKMPHKVRSVQ